MNARAYLLIGLLSASSAIADEQRVSAEVTSVRPLVKQSLVTPECSPPKEKTLQAWLAWDLAAPCRARSQQEVVAYAVEYRVGAHTYRTRTLEHPGDRIAINLRAEPAE